MPIAIMPETIGDHCLFVGQDFLGIHVCLHCFTHELGDGRTGGIHRFMTRAPIADRQYHDLKMRSWHALEDLRLIAYNDLAAYLNTREQSASRHDAIACKMIDPARRMADLAELRDRQFHLRTKAQARAQPKAVQIDA